MSPMAFFRHDSNASHDEQVPAPDFRRGYEGYGRWWILASIFASSMGHHVPFQTDEDAMILATVLGFRSGGAFDDLIAIDDCKSFVSRPDRYRPSWKVTETASHNIRMQKNALYFGAQKRRTVARAEDPEEQAAEDSAAKEA